MVVQRNIKWDIDAWNSYVNWYIEDKRIVKRINQLIKDIARSAFDGIGKPEPLKGNLSGF